MRRRASAADPTNRNQESWRREERRGEEREENEAEKTRIGRRSLNPKPGCLTYPPTTGRREQDSPLLLLLHRLAVCRGCRGVARRCVRGVASTNCHERRCVRGG